MEKRRNYSEMFRNVNSAPKDTWDIKQRLSKHDDYNYLDNRTTWGLRKLNFFFTFVFY